MQFQSGQSGTGYGIVVNNAYPLIKNNEFGLNRHDVAQLDTFIQIHQDIFLDTN